MKDGRKRAKEKGLVLMELLGLKKGGVKKGSGWESGDAEGPVGREGQYVVLLRETVGRQRCVGSKHWCGYLHTSVKPRLC